MKKTPIFLCIFVSWCAVAHLGCYSDDTPYITNQQETIILSEYIIFSEVIDTTLLEPIKEIMESYKVEEYEGVAAIAEFESNIRSLMRLFASKRETFENLKSKMKTPEIREVIDSLQANLSDCTSNLERAIAIFLEIDGSPYRFIARSDEILELVGTWKVISKSIESDKLKKKVQMVAHRVLGW